MESEDQTTSSETTKASDEQGASPQATRSYECSFCKRGFSNAQALGGHMNIHRKDKARLKQSSSHQAHRNRHQPSLDAPSKVEDRTSSYRWPNSCRNTEVASSRDETSQELGIKQLPLFAETPISGEELGQIHDDRGAAEEIKGSPSDLDLELRLGPDPPSPSIGTRKFF